MSTDFPLNCHWRLPTLPIFQATLFLSIKNCNMLHWLQILISGDANIKKVGLLERWQRKKERDRERKKDRKKISIQWLLIIVIQWTYTRIGVCISYRFLCVKGGSHSYSVLDLFYYRPRFFYFLAYNWSGSPLFWSPL